MQSNFMINNRTYFPNLDGLRFFAFLSVFVFHILWATEISFFNPTVSPLLRGLFLGSSLGVNFFFVLSGFLVTYSILEEEKIHSRFNIFSFYKRRILRLWPLYFISLFIGFAVIPIIQSLFGVSHHEIANPLLFILFLSNFNNLIYGYPETFNLGILWTTGVLMQFYLLWPLLLLVVRKFRILLFIAIIIFSVVFRFYYSINPAVLYYHTLSIMSDMAVGGIFALLSMESQYFRNKLRSIPRWQIILIYLLGLTFVIFDEYIFTNKLLISVERLLFSFFFIFIIAEQISAKHSIVKVKELFIPTRLSKYTYGFYCFHTIAITFVVSFSIKFGFHNSYIIQFILVPITSLILSIILGLISYHFFEKWFLNNKPAKNK